MHEAGQATKTYQNYIGGEWVAASGGETNKEFFTNLKVVYHQYSEGSQPPLKQQLAEEAAA